MLIMSNNDNFHICVNYSSKYFKRLNKHVDLFRELKYVQVHISHQTLKELSPFPMDLSCSGLVVNVVFRQRQLTQTHGCLRACSAVILLAGLMVSIWLMRFLASGVTVSHSGEGNCVGKNRERALDMQSKCRRMPRVLFTPQDVLTHIQSSLHRGLMKLNLSQGSVQDSMSHGSQASFSRPIRHGWCSKTCCLRISHLMASLQPITRENCSCN